ncbi:hypothetical protein [Deinococcus sp. Leaf326]|uniref:hypothetical protein n=1 Tax=Deinococcus sp. Leaf326 TaxID=1736338 RepID=UPI0006F921C7|nr:hypothetical protein [Deinococcus sp. Leaf326]KQR37790.1 hypothetical protein ASF71_15015 [Deinococcus sp. Leaf326]
MTLEYFAQVTYTLPKPPPGRKVKPKPGSVAPSNQPDWESTLAPAGDGRWMVIWKTAAMGSVSFSHHDTLCGAWRLFMEHRERIQWLARPWQEIRREMIGIEIARHQQDLARLQAELAAL